MFGTILTSLAKNMWIRNEWVRVYPAHVAVMSIFNLLIYSANSNSYFFLLSSESFFKLCFQHVIPVTNVIHGFVRVCLGVCGCGQVCAGVASVCRCVCVCVQECVWVNTGVCRYAGKRRCAQVSVWVYMSVYGMNFQNTYWRLDS